MFQKLKRKLMSKWRDRHKSVFANYGHDCHMPKETDQLQIRYPGESVSAKIKRCWMRMFIASEEMCQSTSNHLKSHRAVLNEQKRQLNSKSQSHRVHERQSCALTEIQVPCPAAVEVHVPQETACDDAGPTPQYYGYSYQKNYYNEEAIMATISGQLRQEIIMHNCRQLVENVKVFKSLPLVVLVRIMSILHSETYMVNDVICQANTPNHCMYFISAGAVAVYDKFGKEICHLHDGDYFGEMALVTDDAIRTTTVLAVEMCEVYRLEREGFVRAIYPYPDLLEAMKKIATERQEDALEVDVKLRREHSGGTMD